MGDCGAHNTVMPTAYFFSGKQQKWAEGNVLQENIAI